MLYKNLQGMNFAFPSEKVGQAAATTLRIGRGGAVDRPALTSRHGSEPTCLPNWRTG